MFCSNKVKVQWQGQKNLHFIIPGQLHIIMRKIFCGDSQLYHILFSKKQGKSDGRYQKVSINQKQRSMSQNRTKPLN